MNTTLQALDRLARSGNLFPYHRTLIELLETQASELDKQATELARFKKDNTALKSQVTKLTNRVKELERE
ncbi:hypothetical protein JCM19239_5819 [Vibrio variabilis]|uniref:Uncharacterized protein n=1 Tax=Vibrio variabilis TaxID=990271 RepID=A0ABQ0J8A4_9VIBR|nr:hypothetical protein JCM19239_5819 [Vibrio variabilis]